MRDHGVRRSAAGRRRHGESRVPRARAAWMAAIVGALACALALPVASYATEHEEPPTAFEPVLEAENFSITQQRQTIYDTPAYQQQLAEQGAKNREEATIAQASDPERNFSGDLCYEGENGCAGDVRLYHWEKNNYGRVRKVLFTARNGATISARIWSAANPAVTPAPKLPGIVLTNGSVQADEQMYWYAAQALAKDGYIVMTFDPQGQGQSDTFGQAPDENEGFPAQSDGRPFYDGTEDAINFFLSTPKHPYEPVPSCETGTSHAAKQNARVSKGLDAPYNPFWNEVKGGGIGLAGHSYGAAGVSYIAQWDPRVKAVVAWDNLGAPAPSSEGPDGATLGEKPCPANPADRTPVPITKPGLGMSADYGLPPTPNTALPSPLGKSKESLAYSAAGVDSGQINIRGGSHLEFSFIPNQAFGASLRGADEVAWYTSAWFDKYVKGEKSADKRLLTNRWREDPVEAAVDRHHDGNAMSFYYYSRLDIHRANGEVFDCENLRKACAGMVAEPEPGSYSYLATDTSPLGLDRP
jgi:dienelactone hydrolase